MEAETLKVKLWSNAQAYTLATICLLVGVGGGYLVRRPPQAAVKPTPARQEMPAAAGGGMQATPEQLKHMADKTVEPMLAQLQKNPNDVALLMEISKAYFYASQFRSSAEYGERAAKIKPAPGILTTLATVYHYAGDDNKAIESVNRALQMDPKFPGALLTLGMLKWQAQSDPKGAISTWEKLLKIHPNFPKRADVEAMIARAKKA
jgi:cytochrome c-type biogenesis protein CcmH/NrfG